MNKIKSSMIVAAGLAIFGITSCTDKMDNWDVDPSYDRLFQSTSLTIEPEDTKAAIQFGTVPNATMYQVQVSTDSLSDDVDASASNIKTYELTSSPDTLTDLIGDTNYYLRIRSCNDDSNKCSHWLYYHTTAGKFYFHTKAEQILNPVSDNDRTSSTIHISWTKGLVVTHLVVAAAGEEGQKVNLPSDAIANGEYTITGLKASTTYTISIYKDDAKRGEVTTSTFAAAPAGDITYYLPAGENIDKALMTKLAEQGAAIGSTYSVTIVVPGGATINMNGTADDGTAASLVIPDGMALTVFGAAGTTPTVKFAKQLGVDGSHAYIKFQNVNIVSDNCGYLINQTAASNIQTFTLEDCAVSGFSTAFFRLQGSNGITVGSLVLNNCTFDDMCSGYSFIHVDAGSGKGVVNDINIDKCTFSNIAVKGKMFIFSKNTNMSGAVSITNSTFYNVIGNAQYFIDFGSASYGPAGGLKIDKCFFGKSADETTNKNIRSSATAEVTSTYSTADWFKNIGTTALEGTSADWFTNPDALNFKLKKATPEICGDPRWYFEE